MKLLTIITMLSVCFAVGRCAGSGRRQSYELLPRQEPRNSEVPSFGNVQLAGNYLRPNGDCLREEPEETPTPRSFRKRHPKCFKVLPWVAALFIIGAILAIYFVIVFGVEKSQANAGGPSKDISLGGFDPFRFGTDPAGNTNHSLFGNATESAGMMKDAAQSSGEWSGGSWNPLNWSWWGSSDTATTPVPPTANTTDTVLTMETTTMLPLVETTTGLPVVETTTQGSGWWSWAKSYWSDTSEPDTSMVEPSINNVTELATGNVTEPVTELITTIPTNTTTPPPTTTPSSALAPAALTRVSPKAPRSVAIVPSRSQPEYQALDTRYVGTPWSFIYYEVVLPSSDLRQRYLAQTGLYHKDGPAGLLNQPGLAEKIRQQYIRTIDGASASLFVRHYPERWLYFDGKNSQYYALINPGDSESDTMGALWMTYEAVEAFLTEGARFFGRNNLQLLQKNLAIDQSVARTIEAESWLSLTQRVRRLADLIYAINNPHFPNPNYRFDTSMINYADTTKRAIYYQGLDIGSFTNAELDEFYLYYRYLTAYVARILKQITPVGGRQSLAMLVTELLSLDRPGNQTLHH